jgi:serine/threonine protein kinase
MLETEQVLCDRYQLKQKLADNAGRQTWLAEDISIHQKVILKLLTFSDQLQWENLKLFEREAQVLKQLNHPRIPKYLNYFCIDEQMLWFGLVQEYIPGISLKELLIQNKVFTSKEVRKIATDVLKILIYLHGLSPPVLHRDIKPSNLLLGEDSEIYLVDFGAVQDRAAKEGATFTIVGTYGYAPLEQFGGRATPASDLYALGATLIHLLTNIPPGDLPQKNSRMQFAYLVKLNPGFVRYLVQLTEPNLEKRFSNARQALQVLEDNQTAISAFTSSQPAKSKIQLKKSPSSLQIKIPILWHQVLAASNNWTVLVVLGFCLWLLTTHWIWQSGIWLLIGLILAIWSFVPTLLETNISFDYQKFEIEVKLLGLRLRRQRGNVLEIDKVFSSDSGGYGSNKVPEVNLAVGIQEFSFGRLKPPLSPEECHWLVEQIKSWLGL